MVGLAFWVLFGWLWLDLVRGGKASRAAVSITALHVAAVAAGVLVVTLVWVAHNIDIHRRKGPRRGRPVRPPRTDVDRLGRPVAWDLPGRHAGALAAPHLIVTVEGDRKTYRRAEPAPETACGA